AAGRPGPRAALRRRADPGAVPRAAGQPDAVGRAPDPGRAAQAPGRGAGRPDRRGVALRGGPGRVRTGRASGRPQQRAHRLPRPAAGDVDSPPAVDEHVDLAADAELGEVDARLDGEAGARQDAALLVGLQVVHVGAVAVDLLADRVPGAV